MCAVHSVHTPLGEWIRTHNTIFFLLPFPFPSTHFILFNLILVDIIVTFMIYNVLFIWLLGLVSWHSFILLFAFPSHSLLSPILLGPFTFLRAPSLSFSIHFLLNSLYFTILNRETLYIWYIYHRCSSLYLSSIPFCIGTVFFFLSNRYTACF